MTIGNVKKVSTPPEEVSDYRINVGGRGKCRYGKGINSVMGGKVMVTLAT